MKTFSALFLFIFSAIANSTPSANSAPDDIYSIPLKTISGTETTLKPYSGKVMLIVNTASKCGYTDQYKGLQELFEKYRDKGFTVLGFPSNDFLWQEPGKNEEIKKFCELKYKVTFPMFEKAAVNGSDRQPLYQFLLADTRRMGSNKIKWNFEKFLISRSGKIIGRFPPSYEPNHPEIIAAIEKELNSLSAAPQQGVDIKK